MALDWQYNKLTHSRWGAWTPWKISIPKQSIFTTKQKFFITDSWHWLWLKIIILSAWMIKYNHLYVINITIPMWWNIFIPNLWPNRHLNSWTSPITDEITISAWWHITIPNWLKVTTYNQLTIIKIDETLFIKIIITSQQWYL